MEFASLNEYLDIAKKIINKLAPKFYPGLAGEMLRNEDAIADVAYAIMEADWKWNPEYRSKDGRVKSKYSFRNQKAIWAIQTYLQKKTRHKKRFVSLSYCKDPDSNVSLSGILPDQEKYNPLNETISKDQEARTKLLLDTIFDAGLLTDSQAKYIKEYFLEDKTLQEVGTLYGVSREAVRQGVENGLKKLQELI